MGSVLSLIIGLMFVLLISFYLFEVIGDRERFSHLYTVDIEVTDDLDYEIMCPVPVDSGGKLRHSFEEEVRVKSGEATTSVESTNHGPALRIVGYGPANITWRDSWTGGSGRQLPNLSMSVAGGGDGSDLALVYCDHVGVTIHVQSFSAMSIENGWRNGSITRSIDGTSSMIGWQLMSMNTSHFSGI